MTIPTMEDVTKFSTNCPKETLSAGIHTNYGHQPQAFANVFAQQQPYQQQQQQTQLAQHYNNLSFGVTNNALQPISTTNIALQNLQQQLLVSAGPSGMSSTMRYNCFSSPKQVELPTIISNGPTANSFEGVPIFIVPQSGALSINALQRANEFKLAQFIGNRMLNSTPKIDTSKHFHVFVGDLSPEVDNKMLKEAFDKCGSISEAKVIRDPQSLKSRGYGFVSFPDKKDAQTAIDEMNGVVVGKRAVRTNWASRRGSATINTCIGASEDEKISIIGESKNADEVTHSESSVSEKMNRVSTIEKIMASADADNTTVYVGNLPNDISKNKEIDEELRDTFSRFGEIKEIRLFLAHNYGFVIFEKKKNAAQAIHQMNGSELRVGSGRYIRCSWGRTGLGANHEQSNLNALTTAQLIAAQFSALQPNQTIASTTQNANAILAAQIAAINQHQQKMAAAAAAAAIATATSNYNVAQQSAQLLPYYAAISDREQFFDTSNIDSIPINEIYNATQNAWHA